MIGGAEMRSLFGVSCRSRGASRRAQLQLGFSLIELMIGMVLVAVLLGIGMPAFRSFILEQRLRATGSDLRVALTLARSEAIKRNRVVDVQSSGGGWGDGWTIPSPTPGDPDILNHVVSGEIAITTDPNGVTPSFSPAGRASMEIAFEIDVDPGSSSTLGCLQLQLDGRMNSTKGACP